MPGRGSKTSWVPVVWATFGIFLAYAIQMISCRDWWPWTKPGYVTTTRRRNNHQWIAFIAAQPAQKISECKNPLENFSPQLFLIITASSPLIIFQRAKLSTRSITRLCRCNWRTFLRINAAGNSPRPSWSCTKMLRLTGHLQPRRNWPTWSSNFFITHTIFRIWPRWTTTRSLDWKTIESSPFYVGHWSHCCRGDLVGGQHPEFLLSVFQKLEKGTKKFNELRVEYVE